LGDIQVRVLLDLEFCVCWGKNYGLTNIHAAEIRDRDLLAAAKHIVVSVPGNVAATRSYVVKKIPVDNIRIDSAGFDRSGKIELNEFFNGDTVLLSDASKTFRMSTSHRVPLVDL